MTRLLFWLYTGQAAAGALVGFTVPRLYHFGIADRESAGRPAGGVPSHEITPAAAGEKSLPSRAAATSIHGELK